VPDGTPASPQARGFPDCPCPKECTLHGECKLCVAYHARKHALPRCERPQGQQRGMAAAVHERR